MVTIVKGNLFKMYQQEIKFFFPLTEQIPLDLDYSVCQKPSLTVGTVNGGTTITFAQPTTWTTTATFHGEVDTPKLSLVLDKKPNFVVRWLYKLLNINWKI